MEVIRRLLRDPAFSVSGECVGALSPPILPASFVMAPFKIDAA